MNFEWFFPKRFDVDVSNEFMFPCVCACVYFGRVGNTNLHSNLYVCSSNFVNYDVLLFCLRLSDKRRTLAGRVH